MLLLPTIHNYVLKYSEQDFFNWDPTAHEESYIDCFGQQIFSLAFPPPHPGKYIIQLS